jgi:hypothetical protein
MTAMVVWLSANFDLPVNFDHPKIEIVSHAEIVALRYGPFKSGALAAPEASGGPQRREVVAVYSYPKSTIYLPVGWNGESAAELSILVHEMVHHLQNRSGAKFACIQESEEMAYAAQERWLGLYGHNLLTDFEIDGLTLLASTRCFY